MARSSVLLLGFSLLMMVSGGIAAESTYIPLAPADFARSESHIEVSRLSPEFTTISLLSPNVVIEDRIDGYETFQAFSIEGEPYKFAEGEPSVPQVSRFYRIPNTGNVEAILRAQDFDLIENINSFPLQVEGGSFNQMARNQAVYSQDAWYPANVVEVSEPMIMRDFRVVGVTLYPVQVNPVTRQARIYRNLSVDLVANDTPAENELLNPRRPSGEWAPIYRSLIANLDETALDDATTTPGTYLILCHSDFQARRWADSLFEWKTRKGFRVVVDARSNWASGSMINAIQTAYASLDPPLEYVAIVGDPTWTFGLPLSGAGDYDHGFALGMPGDDIEDIGVGRLCGENGTEMSTINAKIMGYERDPYMADTMWYHRAYLLSSYAHEIASNPALMQWGAQQFRHFTGVDSCTLERVNGDVNDANVIAQFNRGVSFFFWRGSWLYEMEPTLAGRTNPGWKLPICLTITCGAGDFDTDHPAISESYLTAGSATVPRGGVCAVGSATSATHAPQNITVTGGVIYNICNLGMEHMGPVLAGAKYWLSLAFGFDSDAADRFSRYNNLLGDPGLSVWTDVPTVMQVTHPTTLNVGARQVTVQVKRQADNTPIKDALVVLWKRGADSTYVKGLTDSEGNIALPVRVNAIGEMTLTVTKRNHKPYLFSIPCVTANQMPMICAYSLDDDNAGGTSGNNDGVMNPGETIDLPIYLKNFGSAQMATNVSAKLSSDNPRVTVLRDSASFTNLLPGDSALGTAAYRIHVAPTMQNRERVLLTMTVHAAAGQAIGSFELVCFSGAVEFVTKQFTDGAFNPGTTRQLRVTVHNTTAISMNSVTGRLISLSPFVQVDHNTASFGTIAADASASNGTDLYQISSNSLTYRGHQAPMLLVLTTSSGAVDTTQFVIYVGSALSNDPAGPDAFGYYAYDNTDLTYEQHREFQYVNISAVGMGQNLNINDTGEQNDVNQVWTAVRRLPFAFKFYGQVYDSITICSNGWAAFGNQGWFPAFRNFSIPGIVAPDAMIAAYWDDLRTSGAGLGVWHYFDEANRRYIIQWKAQNVGTPASNLDFEIILLDSSRYPTFDGNGEVIVQYQTAAMNLPGIAAEVPGSTIGIQAAGCLVGLQYAYQATYAPGAATVTGGRSIVYSTKARMLFGAVTGTVRDSSTGQPMSGVDVSIDGFNYHGTTDSNGGYRIENILIGTYTLRASRYRFNPAFVEGVIIELDSTESASFCMTHPEIGLSTNAIEAVIGSLPRDTTFDIVNSGNGPLDYRITINYAGDEHPTPWDSIAGISVSAVTGDMQISGCEFVGDYWWVTGGGGPGGANRIYRFDARGNYHDSFAQPSTTEPGWFDMAYDGQYVYGSDSEVILGIDATGQVHETIPSPMNPTRAIAYDPETDHFWVSDYTQDIYEIRRNGTIVNQVPNEGTGITGLAWNPVDSSGYKLYIFSQDGSGSLTRVSRYNPQSRLRETVIDLPGQEGDRAGGCTITGGWNSTLLVFAGIVQSATGNDRLSIYEMSFNTTWISAIPDSFSVPGQGVRNILLRFDPETLRPDTYHVDLRISSAILDTTIVLPVSLTRLEYDAVPEPIPGIAPQHYALRQNYPNPFNPTTTIRYDLPNAGFTRLTVFNLLGEQVSELVNERQSAGSYQVRFDAADLPSGMYFYRLESGSFLHTAKMVLMK